LYISQDIPGSAHNMACSCTIGIHLMGLSNFEKWQMLPLRHVNSAAQRRNTARQKHIWMIRSYVPTYISNQSVCQKHL
jgi:hypothetical protein